MPCPSPSPSIAPASLYCNPPRTLSSLVSLFVNYSLSFLSFPSLVPLDGISFISLLHLLSRPSFHPDTPLTQASSDLLQCWKTDENSSPYHLLPPFFHLSLIPHSFYLFSSLSPPVLFSHIIIFGPLLICCHFLYSLFPNPHQHSLKIKVRD